MIAVIIALSIVVFMLIVWLFLILPALKPRDMSEFLKAPVAHRGMHDMEGVPENSFPAFALAIEKGYPIEIDVRLTKDGAVYVIHDDGLRRLCGIDERVSNLTVEEMESLRLSEGGEKIPTLKEMIDFVDGRVPLLVELKGDASSDIAERSYDILKDYNGSYAIQSFSPILISRYRRKTKAVPIGILAQKERGGKLGERIVRYLLGCLGFNFMYRPDFISYRHTDKLPLSAKLCKCFGTCLLCWTIREKAAYDKVHGIYDGFICENIENIL